MPKCSLVLISVPFMVAKVQVQTLAPVSIPRNTQVAGFQVTMSGQFWVITEGARRFRP